MSAAAVELHAAAVSLGGHTIWSDVELRVEPGELTAVLGPNGSGKSTLMRAILGLVPLQHGTATVLGERPGAANAAIGYMPQRRAFGSDVRVRGVDLVRMGLDGARYGLPLGVTPAARERSRAARHRVAEVIELVEADGYARRPIGECSGGEQQRLLIAQALVRRPRLLILDEPLDSLDLPNQTAVAAIVRDVCRAENVAVLLVAHDVNPLVAHLDRVIYVAGGSAVAGSVAEVITSETLSRLYGAPIEVLRAGDGRLVVVGEPYAPHHHEH